MKKEREAEKSNWQIEWRKEGQAKKRQEWDLRCFSAGNPRKLKMPAVLKGSVAFQSGQGGSRGGGVELTLDSRTDLAAAAPFTETPSKGSLASRCALQSSPAPEAPRLCRAAKGEVATKANDAVATTTTKRVAPLSLSLSPHNCTQRGGGGGESWKKGTVAAPVCLALADIYPCRHGK